MPTKEPEKPVDNMPNLMSQALGGGANNGFQIPSANQPQQNQQQDLQKLLGNQGNSA